MIRFPVVVRRSFLIGAASFAACGLTSACAATSGQSTLPEVATGTDSVSAAALSGTVTDMDTGKPVAGATDQLLVDSGRELTKHIIRLLRRRPVCAGHHTGERRQLGV